MSNLPAFQPREPRPIHPTDFAEAFAYFERIGALLFPVPRDCKSPTGEKDSHGDAVQPIVRSWQKHASPRRADWEKWIRENPNCNMGLACAASGLIGVEVDVKAKDACGNPAGFDLAATEWRKLSATWGLPDPLPPYVRSRSGGWHFLFRPNGVDARTLRQRQLVKLPGFKDAIIDTRVNGYLIIPGSAFGGAYWTFWPGEKRDPCPAPAGLIEHCGRRVVPRPMGEARAGTYSKDDVAELLRFMAAEGAFFAYQDWIYAGMILRSEYADDGWDLWWLTNDGSMEVDSAERHWASFADERIPAGLTIGTLLYRAHALGWNGTLRRSSTEMFAGVVASVSPAGAMPLISGGNWQPSPDAGLPEFSDLALASRFVDRHAADLRYVAEWGKWLIWTGRRWEFDRTLRVFDLANKVCREAATAADPKNNPKSIASKKAVAAVESLGRADARIASVPEQWDADPWSLCTPLGIIDLRTGEMREARPDDYVTKSTAVGPGGDCPLWLRFLHRITNGDADFCAYLQRLAGYALTGSTQEHALFFGYGTGRNGKSVFISTLAGILADYHCAAPIETFTATTVDRHPTELADLRGARLVTASETEEGRRWAESRIKMLTGGDTVKARHMRQDFFSFTPQLKLLITGNHKPGLRSVDEAIRRRFNLIPFAVTIPAAEVDRALPDKLRAEWPGILAWAIHGCVAWQRNGLQAPKAVTDATTDYLDSQDAMATWIAERCAIDPEAIEKQRDLWISWKLWAEANGEWPGSDRQFGEKLEKHYHRQKTKVGQTFKGLRLINQVIPFTRGA